MITFNSTVNTQVFTSEKSNLKNGCELLNSIKNKRSRGLPHFFRYEFSDNEAKYEGRVLAKDAYAHYTYTVSARLSRRQRTDKVMSYFFNPRFKFGFIYTQIIDEDSEEDVFKFPFFKRYRISVYGNNANFLPEQEANEAIHYSFRRGAFSPTVNKCFELGAQFSPLFTNLNAFSAYKPRAALSSHVSQLDNYYYKNFLSRYNLRGNSTKGLSDATRCFLSSPVFWRTERYSVKLRRFKYCRVFYKDILAIMRNSRNIISVRRKGMLRGAMKELITHIRRTYTKWKHYKMYSYTDKTRWRRGGPLDMRYVFRPKRWCKKKRRIVSSRCLKAARLFRSDVFSTLNFAHRSRILRKSRFRKKKRRRFGRGLMKLFEPNFED